MKSPQLENGYTRIANELLEVFSKTSLSGREWQLLLVILRKTYGYNKKVDYISLSQLSNETGIRSNHIPEILKKLEYKKIIKINKEYYINRYSLNKDYLNWIKVLPKQGLKVLPLRGDTKERKKTKEITPKGDKYKLMYKEPIIEIDNLGEEVTTKSKRTTFGKYPMKIATHYCKLVGKRSGSRQLPASKELMGIAQEDYPDDGLEEWYKEIIGRIDVANKYYLKVCKIKDWNLSKVAENWDKILNQWLKETNKY